MLVILYAEAYRISNQKFSLKLCCLVRKGIMKILRKYCGMHRREFALETSKPYSQGNGCKNS